MTSGQVAMLYGALAASVMTIVAMMIAGGLMTVIAS